MDPAMILAMIQAEPEVLNAMIVILQAIQKFQSTVKTVTPAA
jgi:hypothetical protein